jgi:hypothetical protein
MYITDTTQQYIVAGGSLDQNALVWKTQKFWIVFYVISFLWYLGMETKAAECEGEASAVAERKANVKAEAKQLMREYLEGSTIHGLRKKSITEGYIIHSTGELNVHKKMLMPETDVLQYVVRMQCIEC